MRRQHIPILTTSAFGLIAICIVVIGSWGIFANVKSESLGNGPQQKASADEHSDAIEAQKQADSKLTRGASAEQRFQELSAKLRRAVAARVIIQLRVAWRPEGAMQQAAERQAQR